jgi:hypothetical protein
MRIMGVQGMHQRWSFQDDPNPRVAMTVNPPLVALGQAKPTLQIEIVLDLLERAHAYEKPRQKAHHHRRHPLMNRVLGSLESIDQLFERLPPLHAAPLARFERRGDFLDVLDVLSDRLLSLTNLVEAPIDASGQSAKLLFGEPPFFSSKLRWSDSRTSPKASAIRSPGGLSGPP